jgi:hypothetical protein
MSYPNPPDQSAGYPSVPGYGAAPAPTRLRGRIPRRLGWVFLVVGIVLVIVGAIVLATKSLGKVDDFQRVKVADGTGTINLEAGNYLAYYEAPGVDSDIDTVPAVGVAIQSPSGVTMVLRTPYGNRSDGKVKILTYEHDGHHGVALWQFKVTESGTYKVQVEPTPGTAADADIAFGKSIAAGTVAAVLLIGGGILLGVAAIVLLIVGYVKRDRHKKQLFAGAAFHGAPPGVQWPQQTGGQWPQQQPPPASGQWPPPQPPGGQWPPPQPPGGQWPPPPPPGGQWPPQSG